MRRPQIYDHLDYVDYLKAWFRWHTRTTGRPGISAFAKEAGCSPGQVGNVKAGRRDLREALVSGFARALDLDQAGTEYLGLLVRYKHPLAELERALVARELQRLRDQHALPPVAGRARRGAGAAPMTPMPAPMARAARALHADATDQTAWLAGFYPPDEAAAMVAQHAEDPGPAITPLPWDPTQPELLAHTRFLIQCGRDALRAVPRPVGLLRTSVWVVRTPDLPRLAAMLDAYVADIAALAAATSSDAPDAVYLYGAQCVPLATIPCAKAPQR